jgi:hypothetical protein
MKVVRYSFWWWAILDLSSKLYVRKDDGKLLLFRSKDEAINFLGGK